MAQIIKIDKDVPMPKKAGIIDSMPINDLNVGDSFVAPKPRDKTLEMWQRAVLVAIRNHKKKGCQYKTSQVDGGVRVWRMK